MLPIGLCRLDRELLVVAANRPFREMLDLHALEAGDLMPRRLAEVERRELRGPVAAEYLDDRSEDWLLWLTAENGERMLESSGVRLRVNRVDGDAFLLTAESVDELQRAHAAVETLERRLARREAELTQAHKMELVGQLAGGLAHDFKNLLTVVLGSLEFIQPSVDGQDEALRHLGAAVDAAECGAELTRRLQAVGRKQTLRPSAVDLADVIERMGELLRRTLPESIELQCEVDVDAGPLIASVDRSQLENSLLNLAINSRDAMPDGGRLILRAERVARAPGAPWPGRLRLSVIDDGEGMEPAVLERAVEPFFTTKDESHGSGLGLSMVHGFARQSGGEIEIDSRVGQGTSVFLELPASHECAVTEQAPAESPAAIGPRRILLAEDSEPVRDVVREMLEKLGHEVYAAETYEAALATIGRESDLDLVITDVVLSGPRNGYQLADELLRRSPDLKLVFMSGYQRRSRHRDSPLDRAPMLEKPFMLDDLSRAIGTALGDGKPLRT